MLNSQKIESINPAEYTMKEESEILKIAVEHMNMHVFVYDIPLQKLYFFSSNSLPFGVLTGSEHSIKDIVNLNIIDHENISVFEKLFEDINDGKKRVDAIIKVHYKEPDDLSDVCDNNNSCGTKTIRWNHIMLVNYFNNNDKPIRAIGTIQNVSNRVESELQYSKEKQYRFAMLADSRRVYEVNVTRDRFIKIDSIHDSTDFGSWNLYTESMANLCKTRVLHEDWDTFLKVATRENLLDGFIKGITEFYCEYRYINDNGNSSWSSSATHLLKDPITNDIKGFIYVKDIDEQKRLEIELYQQAERDSLTGVYNRRTAERLITELLLDSKPTQLHGFLSIDIDNFKLVNDTFGHLKGDYLLQQISSIISGVLRTIDIFARMGGDEFIVFLNDCGSLDHILTVANRLCEKIRTIQINDENDFHSTISVGVSTYPHDGITFSELYKKSDNSLYK